MKTNLLKKLLAGITTLAMAAQFAFVVPASADEAVYSGTPAWTAVTGSAATGTNITLEDSSVTKEVAQHIQGGGSGDRYAYTYPVSITPDNNSVLNVEFWLNVAGANTNTSHFYLMGAEHKPSSKPTSGVILDLEYTSYMGAYTANGEDILSNINTMSGTNYRPTSEAKYAATGLIKYNALIDFAKKTVDLTVYGKETKTYNLDFVDDTTTSFKGFFSALGRSLAGVSIADVNVSLIEKTEIVTYYSVTFDVEGMQTDKAIAEGEYVLADDIPDTTKIGYLFKGWAKDADTENLLSTEDIQALAITADTTFTAVYEKDENYIEPMTSVEFDVYPDGNKLVAGEDTATAASNPISVKIIGELGTNLMENPDSRVTDFNVEYTIKGFNWKANSKEPTADSEEWPYCDTYAKLVVENNKADFQVKEHAFNYYGAVVAKVTYNGETMEITKPLVFIGDETANTNSMQILPRGGYYEDVNAYSPDMVGYQAKTSSDNRGATDVVTDNWAAYGSNQKTVTIQADDEGSRFFRLEASGTSGSSFAANQITAVTDTQVVFDQMVRFYDAKSTILLKSDNPVTWKNNSTTFTLGFSGSELNINGSKISDASTGVWYRIVITSDVTSGKCYAEVYSEGGEKLGASDVVDFENAGSTSPKYYMYRTPDRALGKLDFNKVKITRATIDDTTFETSATAQTIAIPEAGKEAVSETITVSVMTTEGLPAIGKAEWSIADEAIMGVTITPSESDTHTATVTVTEEAPAGELPITVMLGGKSKTINLTLTSSQDSIRFDKAPASISIPLSTEQTDTYIYSATVVDGNGEEIAGKEITYSLYDSKNVNEISAPEGTTFENGILTVTSQTKPGVIYVRATSINSEGEAITKSAKVDIHGLAFDFGAGTEEDIADGYTSVTPSTIYSEKAGYGIEGAATAEGEASLTDAATDYLSGTYTFKANVEKGKIYTVKVTYTGTLTSEYVNADLSGVSSTNSEFGEVTYTIPVIDGVLDLALSGDGAKIASIVIEKAEDKEAGEKPNVFSIGDSTIANNGAWAYAFYNNQANYTEFADVATFTNNGRASRNLSSYYTEGLMWGVAKSVKPGDYVMIGCIGTNGMGSSFEEDLNYYIDTYKALGANVILYSYTPHGPLAVEGKWDYTWCYDTETQTFNGYRQDSYDVITRSVYEERKSELAGFVEIGKNADAAFNAYVDDFEANGHATRDEAGQAIIAAFSDHNHYKGIPTTLMLNGYGNIGGIVEQITAILKNKTGVTVSEAVLADSKATVTVDNSEAAVKDVTVMSAVYENGTLKSLNTEDVSLMACSAEEVTIDAPVGAKIMVWESVDSMIPCDAAQTVE